MITIDARKIKHLPKADMFAWVCYNLIEQQLKQIMKTNLKSINCWRIK